MEHMQIKFIVRLLMNVDTAKPSVSSRDKLIQALFKVMHQYPFNDITVTQITQEANLSRKTFYRLYSRKEELITCFFEKQFEKMIKKVEAEQIHDYWTAVQFYFDYWQHQKEFILLLKEHQLLYLFTEYVLNHAQDFFIIIRGQETFQAFQPILPYLLSYSVGGMHNMMIHWIEHDMEIDSHVLINHLKQGMQSPLI